MTTHAHPIDLAALGTVALARVARIALVHGIALLLTVAGWQPSPVAAAAPTDCYMHDGCAVAVPVDAAAPVVTLTHLQAMTVVQLRLLARAEGYKALARSGRRSQLLAALA
jgi:hypothetical protein